MDNSTTKYKLSGYAILISILGAVLTAYVFKWDYSSYPVNFVDGDARDYYSSLISMFIKHDLAQQQGTEWFILKTTGGTINVHPVGFSILLMPFFLGALILAPAFGFAVDGVSLPFQIAIAAGALFYASVGLLYIKKLLRLHGISDKITALIILLTFFGTNLLHYTISEAAMSHAYSFGLISAFLYHSCSYVFTRQNKHLVYTAALFGLIVLVRPNNVFILLSVFIWFQNKEACRQFFADLFRKKIFYSAILLTTAIIFIQSALWFFQSHSLFHNTYKADGFYWLRPQIPAMLFGFDGGFFIYTPLCLLYLAGLVFMYKENKFSFLSTTVLLLVLFYFFSCYWAYTYFDGIGIRVLVDYYSLFAFLGAKFLMTLQVKKRVFVPVLLALLFSFVGFVYNYQADRGILPYAGMTAAKWKHIFLRTDSTYRDVLGGSYDFKPYSANHPEAAMTKEFKFDQPFDYSQKDFGVVLSFDSLQFNSNRIHLKIEVARKELQLNASKDAMICGMLDDGISKEHKSYFQFRLNEVPASDCCERKEYHYTANMVADFKANDKLSVYLWNVKQQPFLIDKFSVKIYNYNYQIL